MHFLVIFYNFSALYLFYFVELTLPFWLQVPVSPWIQKNKRKKRENKAAVFNTDQD